MFLFQKLRVLLLWLSTEINLELLREKTFTWELLPQAKGLGNFQASLSEALQYDERVTYRTEECGTVPLVHLGWSLSFLIWLQSTPPCGP